MPAYKYFGMLVYFSAHKNHLSLHAMPSAIIAFKKEIEGCQTGKGSIQFPNDQAIPMDLISAIITFRVAENEEKAAMKKRKRQK